MINSKLNKIKTNLQELVPEILAAQKILVARNLVAFVGLAWAFRLPFLSNLTDAF